MVAMSHPPKRKGHDSMAFRHPPPPQTLTQRQTQQDMYRHQIIASLYLSRPKFSCAMCRQRKKKALKEEWAHRESSNAQGQPHRKVVHHGSFDLKAALAGYSGQERARRLAYIGQQCPEVTPSVSACVPAALLSIRVHR